MAKKYNQKYRIVEDLQAFHRGEEPTLRSDDMWCPNDSPHVQIARKLARVIHAAESDDCVTSWSAQERAMNYFNEHGMLKTMDELLRLDPHALDPMED